MLHDLSTLQPLHKLHLLSWALKTRLAELAIVMVPFGKQDSSEPYSLNLSSLVPQWATNFPHWLAAYLKLKAQQVNDHAGVDEADGTQYCATGGTSYANTDSISALSLDSTNSGPGTLTITLLT